MKHNENNVLGISFITQEFIRAEMLDKAKTSLLSKNQSTMLCRLFTTVIFKLIKKAVQADWQAPLKIFI